MGVQQPGGGVEGQTLDDVLVRVAAETGLLKGSTSDVDALEPTPESS
jgi:hypothetical protein